MGRLMNAAAHISFVGRLDASLNPSLVVAAVVGIACSNTIPPGMRLICEHRYP
jgi:hypothetical protein